MRRLVRMAKARWRIELDYRELKEELGLDHYEGRHRLGWHHPSAGQKKLLMREESAGLAD
jgi:SRSO17 transposase